MMIDVCEKKIYTSIERGWVIKIYMKIYRFTKLIYYRQETIQDQNSPCWLYEIDP